MTTDLPNSISLTAEIVGNEVRFVYVEGFDDSLIDVTLSALRHGLAHLSVTISPVCGGIEIKGQVPRVMFGNMMAMEFFGWGSLGDMKMRDVFVRLANPRGD